MTANLSFKMGWRHVTYYQDRSAVSFAIEPMIVGADIVYFPSENSWSNAVPDWIKNDRDKVYGYLKSIKWNRELVWQDSDKASCREIKNNSEPIIPGSLESTPGGKSLEEKRFFHPGSDITFEQARKLWIEFDKRFSRQVRGVVTIFCDNDLVPNSVFEQVELPILKENPNVTLDFRN
ncbi:MAG TPA: hypothetical protein VGV92_09335 [Gammaproteobacteria bacterium]|nr:hypothetical protein [Gammaproteobacteria bacterium]